MHYQIEGFLKTSQKDTYENGCIGEYQSDYIQCKITAFTLSELIKKCKEFTNGDLSEELIESSRLDFHVMENPDGCPASEYEFEQFKASRIDLYLCDYSCIVQKVENADLTAEFEQYKSTCN